MILCVDPEESSLGATTEAFARADFDACGCESIADAREVLDGGVTPDCLVTEYDLPDGTGLELVEETREIVPDVTCILFTRVPVEEIDTDVFRDLIVEYIRRDDPTAREELVDLVEHSLSFRSQTSYPLPEDEDARLRSLERYVPDSNALDESLGRLTELATALFDLDSSAVGFIGSRQERFLSCHGVSFDPMNRERTICTYSILDERVTVIEDISDDPRFRDDEYLSADGIQFYAGAPIVTSDGHAIGVFCIYDSEPRRFSEQDCHLLGLFAEEAMDQLELRYRLRKAGQTDD